MELKLEQTNLNHYNKTQVLFWEVFGRENIPVAFVNEPYVGRPCWQCDSSRQVVNGVLCDGFSLANVEISDENVAVTISDINVSMFGDYTCVLGTHSDCRSNWY